MGESLARAISKPIESLCHDCSRYVCDDMESDCGFGCFSCHFKTNHSPAAEEHVQGDGEENITYEENGISS